ncbi:cystinosin-like protein ERS1 KNAG_0I02800 [Huiozyma naganishii CBS 8797]|uniref:Uncharacterized protein n=1 Tax=Huiozyma naganishii (strain ATCC MYA-139 / BCRC 22969 / CBS 8797 / KCTC 17520 / NBRC 10181 / NCYC 3082 / Yp74L-3) TaxID=1071383 RepID=J7RB15_HUIN7|nr:hypothetical protein KNAG_0I02800 [Kazachstania naganishii CBS 8797]CCK72065.1 hypothetical protein KNAG_0I02800 [Kazachstania naganishii CBS 8797]
MAFPLIADRVLGAVYVAAWSVSMYTPVVTNYAVRSSNGVSPDFVALNTAGYFYLVCSYLLQMFGWVPASEDSASSKLVAPNVSLFDLLYCTHGELLNVVLWTQVRFGKVLWGFQHDHSRRMKPVYYRIFALSVLVFVQLTAKFTYDCVQFGWDNHRTLRYCNRLFLLKICMSLIKYVPQVRHNHERRSVKGFSIPGVMLDIAGGVCSLLQLLLQLAGDGAFTWSLVKVNFGKIALSMVTLMFCLIFILQWVVYDKSKVKQLAKF